MRCLGAAVARRLALGALAALFLMALGGNPASASTFVVNFTGDGADSDTLDGVCADGTGNCTLRAAIDQANASAGPDTITFNIPPGGAQTISPSSALPAISDPVTIDGTTQPGFAGTPIITLRGDEAGTSADGLRLASLNSTIEGLVINRFDRSGIRVEGAGGNAIRGNFIGTETGR